MQFGLDNLFLTHNKVRHVIEINRLKDLIFLLHISHNKHLHQHNINQHMEQDQADTHNQYQVLVRLDLLIELSRPYIHDIQQIVVDDFDRHVVVFQRGQGHFRGFRDDDVGDI